MGGGRGSDIYVLYMYMGEKKSEEGEREIEDNNIPSPAERVTSMIGSLGWWWRRMMAMFHWISNWGWSHNIWALRLRLGMVPI